MNYLTWVTELTKEGVNTRGCHYTASTHMITVQSGCMKCHFPLDSGNYVWQNYGTFVWQWGEIDLIYLNIPFFGYLAFTILNY